jgi:hypothetical protein
MGTLTSTLSITIYSYSHHYYCIHITAQNRFCWLACGSLIFLPSAVLIGALAATSLSPSLTWPQLAWYPPRDDLLRDLQKLLLHPGMCWNHPLHLLLTSCSLCESRYPLRLKRGRPRLCHRWQTLPQRQAPPRRWRTFLRQLLWKSPIQDQMPTRSLPLPRSRAPCAVTRRCAS